MRSRFSPWLIVKALTGKTARGFVQSSIIRGYALLVCSVVLAAGYWAVRYLVQTVFLPPEMPAQITQWQGRLDVAALRTDKNPGVEQTPPRSPMSHYHQVDQWFQPDVTNGCTIVGCHDPLPHGPKSKVPAFANFHTTFLACSMCHIPQPHRADAKWISTVTGLPQDIPAILQLMRYLEVNTNTIQSQPAAASGTITALLQQTITTLGTDPILDQLLSQMQSTQPGSPVWKDAVAELIAELPQHARGEYRAKLDWVTDDRNAEFKTLSTQAQRHESSQVIHARLAKEPARCLACHDNEPGMLDFNAAGYSPNRAKALTDLEVARLMQHIREGQHFYLPNMEDAK
jgi:hypothetical protein